MDAEPYFCQKLGIYCRITTFIKDIGYEIFERRR